MGSILDKDTADKRTGMMKRENKLVRSTWHSFCHKNADFGSLLLVAMFTRHPKYQALFPKIQGREVRFLRDDAKFRAFGAAVGRQLTAIVDSVDNYDDLYAAARQNAVDHTRREGMQAEHFEGFFTAALDQMIESNKSDMTPAAVTAWEKFFETLNMITKHVFDEAAKEPKAEKVVKKASAAKKAKEAASPPQELRPSSPGKPSSGVTSTATSPITQKTANVSSPLAIQSVIKGARSDRESFWKSGTKGKRGKRPT
ncbi:hypothetical protein HPB50_012706 [Hyalomma asiaticum]|uniref:Uncharacterized protein n=1 Tax=Hyalomma asiaticum TaxID=266040 RepID=A0ACB7RYJ7_HYAAI|nr:hypothetical protein HPB50_012706 [Hyalomma asiaticum]